MPQLDKVTFVLQFYHLLFFFIIIYLNFEFFVLPKLFQSFKSNFLIVCNYEFFIFSQYEILNAFFCNLNKELFSLLNFLTINVFHFLSYLTSNIRFIVNIFFFNYNLNDLYYHIYFLFNSIPDILNFEIYVTSFLITERLSATNFANK